MAAAIDLDPRKYEGTYKLIGGSLALDFANLVSYRGTEQEHDWLEPLANVATWAEIVGITQRMSGDISSLLDLREALARVFLAIADGETPAAKDLDLIGRHATDAFRDRRLRFRQGASSAHWEHDDPTIEGEVTIDAARLLTSEESVARISACGECRWVFQDTTRNRSRKWCDPADCGNRARQRRYYLRHDS